MPGLKAALLAARGDRPILDGKDHNCWDWNLPETQWLKEQMSLAAKGLLGNSQPIEVSKYWGRSWGNILQQGSGFSYQGLHAHHEADFFAIFYVDANEVTEESGALVLHDPRFLNNTHIMNREGKEIIQPKTGELIMAPGYVWHEVLPYQSFEPRMTIACNFQYSLREIDQ